MKKIKSLLATVLILGGCQSTQPMNNEPTLSAEEKQAIAALDWLEGADARRDAVRAIEQGDYRVFAIASRNPTLPGIPDKSAAQVKEVCGLRYLDGVSDMVFGDAHLKLLQAAQDYAIEYNRLVMDACLK